MTDLMQFEDAKKAVDDLASARRRAEDDYEDQIEKAADAEQAYRKRFATKFLEAEGTVAEREQIARKETADLARDRDLQDGLARAYLERLRGLEGERSMLRLLIDWSMKEGTGPQPQWTPREAA